MESNILWIVAENAVNLFEAIMLFSFLNSFYKKTYDLRITYGILTILYSVFVSLLNAFSTNLYINLILTIIVEILILLIFYKGNILNKILSILLFISIWVVSEVATIMLLTAVLRIDVELITNQSIYRLMGMFFAKILLFLIIKIIVRFKSNSISQKLPFSYWGLLLLVPVTSSILMLEIFTIIKNSNVTIINPYIMASSFVGLLFTNIIIFYLFEKIITHEELKYKFILTQKQIELQEKHYSEIEENYKDIRRIWHDIKNHIICIKSMISNDDKYEAQEYLENLEKIADGLVIPNLSGNKAIDAVLGQKYLASKRKEIDMIFNICINEKIKIEPQDICALLGNALDNAIEACEKLNDNAINKVIKISISCERSFLKVRVINPIIERPIIENNSFITTKPAPENHGIGLDSIERIINKYSGKLIIKMDNNEFDLLAIMNM